MRSSLIGFSLKVMTMATKKKDAAPAFKLPKTLAQCADLAYELRNERLDIQRSIDPIKEKESLLKDHLIENLPKSDASGVSGAVANAKITSSPEPRVEDWDAFYAWVKKQKGVEGFNFLGRTIAKDAIVEYQERTGKLPPGIGTFNVIKVSLTKI